MNNPQRANYSRHNGRVRVRVICPECGAGGAHDLFSYHPLCHLCNYESFMQPASNNKAVCTWGEAQEYQRKRGLNE